MSSIIQIKLEDNESLVKTKITPVKKEPNYIRVGNGTMNKHKIESINLLTELVTISTAGRWLIAYIVERINWETNYDPVVKIAGKDLSSTEQDYLKDGYKELVDKDLVKRIKRGYYMVNPNAIIPVDYKSAMKIWESV